tara:strand:- start:6739 stop:7479 length:741 start_codon:yes stop_codon:yes gene_type:complete
MFVRLNADAVVSIWDNVQIRDQGDGSSTLNVKHFGRTYNLCDTEPFRDQPMGAGCTGFLVAPDIMVTAGHCINKMNYVRKRFVFGYRMTSPRSPVTNISNEEIYKVKRVIVSKVESHGADFAVVQLDRPVANHDPLILSTRRVKKNDQVSILGHPVGLPLKYASDAQVVSDWSDSYFKATLDSYGGNSGSPVFNKYYEVVGILVRGEHDFIMRRGCRVSAIIPSSSFYRTGESVTRVSQFIEYVGE